MRKIFLLLPFCLGLGFSDVTADDRPTIPPDVKYKFIDDQQDASLRAALLARFAQGETGVAGLFHNPCICAPGFWKSLSAADTASFKHAIPSHFSIPNTKTGVKEQLEGATIKDPDDLANLAKLFSQDIGLKPTIRRLTTDKIKLLWAIYPFDIEEPVYAIVNDNRCFVVCLLKSANSSEYNVTWIDELSAYTKG